MRKITNPEVAKTFDAYPHAVRQKLMFLRQLIFETAAETATTGEVEETLKWGEPGYLAKAGSTIRMGWKHSCPNRYYLYFHCKTRLVETFRELYGETLQFEGNRAIVFTTGEVIPVDEVKHCIALSLRYHQIKHLAMLGV